MKKLILFIVMSAACLLTLSAARLPQSEGNSISVTDTEVVVAAENVVSVSFQLHVGSEVTARNRSMIIRPVLSGAGQQVELPPVIVRGDKAKAAAENRAMSLTGVMADGRFVTGNGTTLDYFAQIPWQDWMNGSQLAFNGLGVGKGDPTEVTIGTVADGLLAGQTGVYYPAPADNILTSFGSITAYAPATPAPAPATPATTTPASSTVSAPEAPVTPTTTIPAATTVPAAPMGSVTVPAPITTGSPVIRGATVGDELAARFTFVEPVEKYRQALDESSIGAIFDYNMPILFGKPTEKPENDASKFVEMTREGAVYVQFERGSVLPSRSIGQNNTMLVEMLSTLKVLGANPQTRVAQIVVVGFSAPEGTAEEKETLAMERAGVVRDAILANVRNVDPAVISVYNGAVDWPTIRALVAESNIPDKYQVLELIDNVPEWGNTRDKDRLAVLQELNNGAAFRYIRDNFFPLLRQTGAYVKIYYENVL